ncbi:hypothetical protein N665_1172s0008 [Sinapis alba]|nr:hypothetical protein N665_1172s0008 [Sinapis alba]
MSSSRRLSRDQKGKQVASVRSSSEDPADEIHAEAMMDTANLDRAQRLLVAEARGQFRGDGDGQDAVDTTMILRGLYPGNIFADEGPLERMRVRPSVVAGQDWSNVESSRSTTNSVETILRSLTANGVTFIIPRKDQRPWTPPMGYQCVYESYFQNDTRLWFPIPRIVTAYAFRRGVALSNLINGSIRLMVALSVMAAEAGSSLSVRAFEELTSAFEEPPSSRYRVLWNAEMEDWISSSVPYIKNPVDKRLSLFTPPEQKEINRARRMKEHPDLSQIVAARPSAKKKSSGSGANPSGSRGTAAPVAVNRVPSHGTAPKKPHKKKRTVFPERDVEEEVLEREDDEETLPEEAHVDGSSKKKKKKKKKRKRADTDAEALTVAIPDTEDPSPEEVPLRKRRKKADGAQRSSFVCEEELKVLAPGTSSEIQVSDDEDNQTVAARARKLERRPVEDNFPEIPIGDRDVAEESGNAASSGGRRGHSLEKRHDPSGVGSETRVSEHPGDASSDKFHFEFNRELPLSFYPEDCGRFILSLKGGPDQMPPVKDLIFRDEYQHAASSSVKNHGDWNILIGKYNTALRQAREQIRKGEEGRKDAERKHKEALRVITREKEEAAAREKEFREEFNKTRAADQADLKMCKDSIKDLESAMERLEGKNAGLKSANAAGSLKLAEETSRLRMSRKYELRETQRDLYEDARCLYSQAFGTRKCLEQIRDSGVDIPQETIDTYAEQEEHFKTEAARLEVKEIPEDFLRLSPLVLESQFLVEDAADALRTPRVERVLRAEDLTGGLVLSVGSSSRRPDQGSVPEVRVLPEGVPRPDQATKPTIDLTNSPSRALKEARLVGSSTESSDAEPKAGDGPKSPMDPAQEGSVGVDPSNRSFGRVSGPEEAEGDKDLRVVNK